MGKQTPFSEGCQFWSFNESCNERRAIKNHVSFASLKPWLGSSAAVKEKRRRFCPAGLSVNTQEKGGKKKIKKT